MDGAGAYLRVVLAVATGLGWLCLLVALYYVDQARPVGFKTDRFFGVSRRRVWEAESVETAFWWVVAALGVGVVALMVDLIRSQRSGEPASKAALALTSASLVAFLAHVASFS